jgi:hypothetical protein
MLSSVWVDPEVDDHAHAESGAAPRKKNVIQRVATRFNERFERVADRYPRWLDWSLGTGWWCSAAPRRRSWAPAHRAA